MMKAIEMFICRIKNGGCDHLYFLFLKHLFITKYSVYGLWPFFVKVMVSRMIFLKRVSFLCLIIDEYDVAGGC